MNNRILEKFLKLFIVSLVPFLIIITRFFLSITGVIHSSKVYEFAVDSEENLYIGWNNEIEVYKDGNLIRKFPPHTSRFYSFFIENDCLIIGFASTGKGGEHDLTGNELSYGNYEFEDIRLTASKMEKYVINGHVYQSANKLGILPFIIRLDGETVYQISNIDYFFNGFPFWAILVVSGTMEAVVILDIVSDKLRKK